MIDPIAGQEIRGGKKPPAKAPRSHYVAGKSPIGDSPVPPASASE